MTFPTYPGALAALLVFFTGIATSFPYWRYVFTQRYFRMQVLREARRKWPEWKEFSVLEPPHCCWCGNDAHHSFCAACVEEHWQPSRDPICCPRKEAP